MCLSVCPQFAVEKLTELEHWKQELQDEAHTLIDFFCEDKETMKLDECLQIFRDFCTKFIKAVKVWKMASVYFLSGSDSYIPSSRPSQPSGHGREMVEHFWVFRKVRPRQRRQALDHNEWEVVLPPHIQRLPYHQVSGMWGQRWRVVDANICNSEAQTITHLNALKAMATRLSLARADLGTLRYQRSVLCCLSPPCPSAINSNHL